MYYNRTITTNMAGGMQTISAMIEMYA